MTNDPEIRLLLAEYATSHTDGTVTVVRGWITNWTPPAIPQMIPPYLVVELRNMAEPKRDRDFSLEIKAPSGLQVALVQGRLSPPSSPSSEYVIPLSFQIVEYGFYPIAFACDGTIGAMTLEVRKKGEH